MPKTKSGVETFLDRQVKADDSESDSHESDSHESVVSKPSTSTKRKAETAKGLKKKAKSQKGFDVVLTAPDVEEDITDRVQLSLKEGAGLEANGKTLVMYKYWLVKTPTGEDKPEFSRFKFRMDATVIPNLIQALNIFKKQLKLK